MMVIQSAMRSAIEPRAIDDISDLAIHNKRQHQRPVLRIVFEVGGLDDMTSPEIRANPVLTAPLPWSRS